MTDTQRRSREIRLYLVALVAGVYVLAWSLVAPMASAKAPAPPSRAVWLDELPRENRPAVMPPPGWRLADRHETAAPIPRRLPATPAPRLRTRSS